MQDGTFVPKSTMSFQLPRPLKDAIGDYSESTGESVSTIMRWAITEFLAKQRNSTEARKVSRESC